ncbi:MAG: hypothetical protein DRR16_12470 [Candidatus Parabeggiatoa sp. nov. 3]|mgnify:CR=1 FL=1|jgi:hypothetical protein|nr:MAG: hypothetical protein DRR00_13540 [Gammaproteobacteria bacterium]RKZ61799.1 MAG: hypothetical protein DRQ99_19860 [Gammaproteobacteria bacterium]RKZ85251.1 MAG: hypothetical protein DRR16_12470 [Gammaproteobacteria bacterium]
MGTRAKIRIENGDKYLCSKYFNMDGHVENWAPILIAALNQTTPSAILKNRQLLKFMFDDYERDDYLDYLCEVDISDDDYKITIYGYEKKLLFEGTLDEFSEKYDEIY